MCFAEKPAMREIEGKECARGKPIKREKCRFLPDFILLPLEEVSLSHNIHHLKQSFNPADNPYIFIFSALN